MNKDSVRGYLEPGYFIDSDSPEVTGFTEKYAKGDSDREKAVSLFLAVRDKIRYDPYNIIFKKDEFKASTHIKSGRGYCVHKATCYAAVLRAAGIPARISFADVKNHLSFSRLEKLMGTNTYYYHGITELCLDGRWLKATPVFNIELCEKKGTEPLRFDGYSDCILQPFDGEGRIYMEYLDYHGTYDDVPYDMLKERYRELYPGMFGDNGPWQMEP